ncbi:DNA polymerase III subunit beta [Calidithermus chliarophilus]|uniref:DNA polymerase III subunit beta n=1 Tax=Calidithermus chliarophilus TaxID=52023 RepID=UPI0004213A67|nr:DNA polymerase III subunit beta [Calidithermus chliarophilus]
MQVPSKPLQNAVQALGRVIRPRQSNPLLTHLWVQPRAEKVLVGGTDGEHDLVFSLPRLDLGGDEAAFCLPFATFGQFLANLGPDAIDLSRASEGLEVRSGKIRATFSLIGAEDYPDLLEPIDPRGELRVQAARLAELLEVEYAASREAYRGIFQGIQFEVRPAAPGGPARLRLVASDGYRLAYVEGEASGEAAPFVLPYRSSTLLKGLLGKGEGEARLELGRGKVRAHGKDYTATFKLLEGEFPDYHRIIPARGAATTVLEVPRAELMAVIRRLMPLAEGLYRRLDFQLNPEENTLVISCRNEYGQGVDQIAVTVAQLNPEATLAPMNGEYVLEALAHLGADTLEWEWNGLAPSALREASAVAVVVPLRV